MTLSSTIRRKVGLVGSLMTAVFLLASGQVYGLTAAGQPITNEATVTYEDNLGIEFTSTSNEAVVTVAPVYAATIEQDRTRTGAPGQTVYLQHLLRNTGNVADTYDLSTFLDGLTTNGTVPTFDGTPNDGGSDGAEFFVYRDQNNNGQPDSGEPAIVEPTDTGAQPITLNANETARLLIAFSIPGGATASNRYGVTITAVSQNGAAGTVDDLTTSPANGRDGLEGTNNDDISVSLGAVLNPAKAATFYPIGDPNNTADENADPANDRNVIRYTLQVGNTGGAAATDVDIVDAIPTGTTFFRIVSVAGLLASNSDQEMVTETGNAPDFTVIAGNAAVQPLNEALLSGGIDLNEDGDAVDTALDAIAYQDASLPPNTTISIVYEVTVDPGQLAGTDIDNIFYADDVPSPRVTITLPQVYAVDARDTGDDAGPNAGTPGVNDGADDDDTFNDIQNVDVVSDGSTVRFSNLITNNGNGTDTIELAIVNGGSCGADFPTGTTFSFFNGGNTATLSNTNGTAGVDTGPLAAGASVAITVRADLPDGQTGGPFCATLTATSAGDNSKTDTKSEQVTEVRAPALDLANADYSGTGTAPQSVNAVFTSPAGVVTGFNDGVAENAHDDAVVTVADDVAAGAFQDFELFIANEGVAPDSYDLSTPVLPTGWTVQFIQRGIDGNNDGDTDGGAPENDSVVNAGDTVTTTPLIPAGGVFQYTARVQTSANPAQSLADSGGVDDSLVPDGDGDYRVTFRAESTTNAGSFDEKTDSIDIATNAALEVTPDLNDQVQPGGSVSYSNQVQNTGNLTLFTTLSLGRTPVGSGFDDTTTIDIDGTGPTELENLFTVFGVPTTIQIDDGTGTLQSIELSFFGPGNTPVFQLEPGEVIPLDVTIQAPANAAQGDEDFFTITGEGFDVALLTTSLATDSATDRTEVIAVQVRLTKTLAIDSTCGCNAETATFEPIPATGPVNAAGSVEPNECVIWRLTATNQSAESAFAVTISDAAPPFTKMVTSTTLNAAQTAALNVVAGSPDGLFFCAPNAAGTAACATGANPLTVAAHDETAIADGDDTAVAANEVDVSFLAGTLASGESATAAFCVIVD